MEDPFTGEIDIDKPLKHINLYRGLELKNGLRVLLVSNPWTEISSVALNVACGSLMDPENMQGAALLCEQMLLYGHKKADAFDNFLASYEGKKESLTYEDNTLFRFCIKPEHLRGGLRLFAPCFVEPLFSKAAMEREVRSIEDDHETRRKMDFWRIREVEKSLSHDKHAYRKSFTENSPEMKKVSDFFNQWYCANLMTLVIVGKDSLDQLEKFVRRSKFHEITNKSAEMVKWSHPWEAGQLGKRVEIVSFEKSTRMLKLCFPLSGHGPFHEYESNYIGFLVFYNGRNGLASKLKETGLVTAVRGGYSCLVRGFATYAIIFELTEKGLDRIDEVMKEFFRYVGMLNASPLPEIIHDELKHKAELRFNSMEMEGSAFDLATALHNIPFKDVLTSYFVTEFKQELIRSVLESFTPANMNYFVVSSTFAGGEGFTEEPIFGAKMHVDQITEKAMAKFNKALEEENNYFCLPEINHPVLLDTGHRVWFLEENTQSQIVTWISITSPVIVESARTSLLAHFYGYFLENCLFEPLKKYITEEKLTCSVEITGHSINIKVSGCSEKQPLLLNQLKGMLKFCPGPKRFLELARIVCANLEDFPSSVPEVLGLDLVNALLKENFWSCEEKRTELEKKTVTWEDVQTFKDRILSDFNLEIFVHGKITRQEALNMARDVRTTLQETYSDVFPLRERCMKPCDSVVYRRFQNTDSVSCVCVVWQTGVESYKEDAILRLLKELMVHPQRNMSPLPLENRLDVSPRFASGVSGLQIVMQVPSAPESIFARIKRFFEAQHEKMEAMEDEVFQELIEAASHSLQPETFEDRSAGHWKEITSGYPDFDRQAKQCEELKKLTKEEVRDFYESRIGEHSTKSGRLAVFVHGKDDFVGEQKRRIENDLVRELEYIGTFRATNGFEFSEAKDGIDIKVLAQKLLKRVEDAGFEVSPEAVEQLLENMLKEENSPSGEENSPRG